MAARKEKKNIKNTQQPKGKSGLLSVRPPIVTFLGHVDHGKTSILDVIRKTNIQSLEYGGITQHTGSYQIEYKSQKITFIDTPGHEAFTQMRARGGKAADIVVLVVAADDGVMAQTKEAIAHAKVAKVPVIVAINKMDLPGADTRKVKQGLAQENILVEDWGGEVVSVELSAKTGEGIEKLLDAIMAVSELLQLKANPEGELEAMIIESRKDNKKGVVVSAIVRNGTMEVGSDITASGSEARVRSLMNDKGQMIKKAEPGLPVEILGFKDVPRVGDLIMDKGSELAQLAIDGNQTEIIGQETKRVIGIVVRADTVGTLEAVKANLAKLVTENVDAKYSIKFLLTATGDVTGSDVMLAESGKGLIVGFDVKVLSSVMDLAQERGVTIKVYKTIYELIDEVHEVLEGTAVEEEAKIKGRAQVLKTFKLLSGDVIAGCQILAGSFKVGSRVAIYDKNPADLTDEDEPLYKGAIRKLKVGKDEVQSARKGEKCGILLKPQFTELKKELFLESF